MPIDLGVIACGIKISPNGGVIYAALQPLGQFFEIAAFLAKVLGEIFRAVPFALVPFIEIFERALIPIGEVCLVSLAALFAHIGILFDFVERFFAHAALAVPLFGEVLVILEHEFRLGFVCVQAVAERDKIAVVVKGAQIHPHAVKAAVVVLCIRAAINGGVLAFVVVRVLADFVSCQRFSVVHYFSDLCREGDAPPLGGYTLCVSVCEMYLLA